MRNQEIAKAMKLIAEGFTTLAVAFEGAEDTITTVDVKEVAKEVVKKVEDVKPVLEAPKKEAVVETKEEPTTEGTLTPEELDAKTYNEIKALAKELGVKAVGSKKSIIDNILAVAGTPVSENEETEEEVVEAPSKTPVEDEEEVIDDTVEEIEEDNEGEEVDAEETLYDVVERDLADYSDEELADILSDVGISPKGKRQALVAKIVQAIEDGKLAWDEESTEEVVEEKPEPKKATKEPVKKKEVVEEEPEDEEETFLGTETRRVACEKEVDSIEKALDKDEISHKEIIKYLKDFYNGKYVSQGLDSDIDEYIAIQCDLIDDEGDKHELADPYYIGDDVFCCGQKLKDVKGDLYCEICGTTYTM